MVVDIQVAFSYFSMPQDLLGFGPITNSNLLPLVISLCVI